jgi:hypothetical protein
VCNVLCIITSVMTPCDDPSETNYPCLRAGCHSSIRRNNDDEGSREQGGGGALEVWWRPGGGGEGGGNYFIGVRNGELGSHRWWWWSAK